MNGVKLHMRTNTGFSLLELMIVMLLIGIATAISLPAFGRFKQSWKLMSEADQMASALRTARSTAVMKNIDAVFQFNPTDGTYSYFEDADGDGVADGNEYQSAMHELTSGISVDSHTLPAAKVTFEPKGNTMESGAILIANRRGAMRTIRIYGGTGNIRVDS